MIVVPFFWRFFALNKSHKTTAFGVRSVCSSFGDATTVHRSPSPLH